MGDSLALGDTSLAINVSAFNVSSDLISEEQLEGILRPFQGIIDKVSLSGFITIAAWVGLFLLCCFGCLIRCWCCARRFRIKHVHEKNPWCRCCCYCRCCCDCCFRIPCCCCCIAIGARTKAEEEQEMSGEARATEAVGVARAAGGWCMCGGWLAAP